MFALQRAIATFAAHGVRSRAVLAGETTGFASRQGINGQYRRPATALVSQMPSFRHEARSRQVALLSRQLELEKGLASLVEDAYRLITEERDLLRSTRPTRDPIDVLEAKIRGGETSEGAHLGTELSEK